MKDLTWLGVTNIECTIEARRPQNLPDVPLMMVVLKDELKAELKVV